MGLRITPLEQHKCLKRERDRSLAAQQPRDGFAALLMLLALVGLVSYGCSDWREPIRVPATPVWSLEIPARDAIVSGQVKCSGWVIHTQGVVQRIDVLLDGAPVAEADRGLPREDICRYYPGRVGCPNIGWQSLIDLSSVEPGEHRIGLRIRGPSGEQFDSPPRPLFVRPQA